MRHLALLTLAAVLAACADATNVASDTSDETAPDAAGTFDAAPSPDAVVALDAAPAVDASPDAAPVPDAAPIQDAAPLDAAPDAMPDSMPDACVPGVEACNAADDDCDGRADEGLPLYWPDADGDGFGGPAGAATCMPVEGRIADDRDCDDADPDVHPDAEDKPDPMFTDSNCDQIDGVRRRMFFVDAAADPEPRDGSPEHPFGTVAEALAAAIARPDIGAVGIAIGRYEERVTVVDGVSLHGGYDPATSWSRNRRGASVIAGAGADRGRVVSLVAEAIHEPTVLDLLTVEAAGDPGPGGAIYAIYARAAAGLVLREVTARAGDAPAGADGADGAPGEDGEAGRNGGNCGGPPGAGGDSPCGATGGQGGAGSPRGSAGQAGQFPGCGGAGGPAGGGGAGGDGAHGCSPAAPAAGADGPGGDGGALDPSAYWVTSAGADGVPGPFGPPGGGGGGGGGATVIDGTGGGGGGGGAGGCGGQPGGGGRGGGGSFALFVVESTGLVVEGGDFQSGTGGAGGRGARGGDGGRGAEGRPGGLGREAFACGGLAGPGAGGSGGHGADGARGGHGGGGAGGPSVSVWCAGTTLAIGADTFLRPGVGGRGGDSPVSRGRDGVSASTSGCD